MMSQQHRSVMLCVIAVSLSLVCAYQSRADSTTLQLSACNVASLCNAGTIGLATSGSGSTEVIVVTVTLNSGFGLFGNGMGNGAIGWNGTNLVGASNIPAGFMAGSGGTFDGFGSFSFSLDGPPASGAVGSLTFDITCSGGCTSVSQVTGFSAHIINNTTGNTGFDSTTGTGVVPEPATMLLFGSGLVALGAKLRRRKTKNPVAA